MNANESFENDVTFVFCDCLPEAGVNEHARGRGHDRPLHLHPDVPHPHSVGHQNSPRSASGPRGKKVFTVLLLSAAERECLSQVVKTALVWILSCKKKSASFGHICPRRPWTFWCQSTKVWPALSVRNS